ncbi:hypothetical protein GCM10009799_08110 [Nocardiopsis rhodophaea]|uniref:Secreted protein n=1 Tax=Nocardiopsis rhodophaea TaxID=280238 RepID=A0ABN2SG47_9ACTN
MHRARLIALPAQLLGQLLGVLAVGQRHQYRARALRLTHIASALRVSLVSAGPAARGRPSRPVCPHPHRGPAPGASTAAARTGARVALERRTAAGGVRVRLSSIHSKGVDGDEYRRTQPQATRGWWEPGGMTVGKITPEPPEERPEPRCDARPAQ